MEGKLKPMNKKQKISSALMNNISSDIVMIQCTFAMLVRVLNMVDRLQYFSVLKRSETDKNSFVLPYFSSAGTSISQSKRLC